LVKLVVYEKKAAAASPEKMTAMNTVKNCVVVYSP
jgi:hypothetical protein